MLLEEGTEKYDKQGLEVAVVVPALHGCSPRPVTPVPAISLEEAAIFCEFEVS